MSGEKAFCPECRTETAVRVKPVFAGFEKAGEERSCTFCGHLFGPEDRSARSEAPRPRGQSAAELFGQPYEPPKLVNPFGDTPLQLPKTANPFGGPVEIPKALNPFGDASGPIRICRHCKNYVVNPFTQMCMLHHREVSATDTCPEFDLKRG